MNKTPTRRTTPALPLEAAHRSRRVCLPCLPSLCTALGFNSWQRAVISHAGQSYTLEPGRDGGGDTLRIITQDLRGTSELELPLSGKSVSADDGDNGARVCRSAYVKGSPPAVVITERKHHASPPLFLPLFLPLAWTRARLTLCVCARAVPSSFDRVSRRA